MTIVQPEEHSEIPESLYQLKNFSVKIVKNTKGYNWECSARSDDAEEVLDMTYYITSQLEARYGANRGGPLNPDD